MLFKWRECIKLRDWGCVNTYMAVHITHTRTSHRTQKGCHLSIATNDNNFIVILCAVNWSNFEWKKKIREFICFVEHNILNRIDFNWPQAIFECRNHEYLNWQIFFSLWKLGTRDIHKKWLNCSCSVLNRLEERFHEEKKTGGNISFVFFPFDLPLQLICRKLELRRRCHRNRQNSYNRPSELSQSY